MARAPLPLEKVSVPTRAERSAFVAWRFAPWFGKSLLDVGCFEAPLRKLLPDVRYVGIDFCGDPDVVVDLEKIERLPFDDATFDCVIAIEVLEHLDALHRVFDEMLRVSRKHVIVSLPNCWRDARLRIERGHGSFAHYGLPVDRPDDRHKWFFNVGEARAFFEGQAERRGLQVKELFASHRSRGGVVDGLRRLRHPGERFLNRYAQTLWAVLAKS